MSDIFISYSRQDKAFVGKLREALIAQKQEVWIDWESIPPSQAWWGEIQKGIAKANNFVVILSPNSMGSPICQMEIEYARQLGKRIIPVLHLDYKRDDVVASMAMRLAKPEQETVRILWGNRQIHDLYDANESLINHINYFFFRSEDDFEKRFEDLFGVIRTDYDHKEQHTTLELRALEWERRGKDASFLLLDNELKAAQLWLQNAEGKEPTPTPLHLEYIQASERRTRQLQNIRRASVLGSAVAVLALIFALSASIIGVQARNSANEASTREAAANNQVATSTRQVATAESQLIIATHAQGDAEQRESEANDRVEVAEQDLATVQVAQTQAAQDLATIQAESEKQAGIAESRRLAAEAQTILGNDGGNAETAALLAIQGLKMGYSEQADTQLMAANDRLSTVQIFQGHMYEITSVAFSPDGKYIALGSGNSVQLWEVGTNRMIQTLQGHTDKITQVTISPSGQYILTVSADDTAGLWESNSGKRIHTLQGYTGGILNAIFSPDEQKVLTASLDGIANLWDIQTGEIIHTYEENPIYRVAFSPDGESILAVGIDTVLLLETKTGDLIQTFEVDDVEISNITFSPSGKSFLTQGHNTMLRLWDIKKGKLTRIINEDYGIDSAVFSPNGEFILTGQEYSAQLWEIKTGNLIRTFVGQSGLVQSVAFSPDGTRVLTGSSDGTARLWEVSSDDHMRVFRHTNYVQHVVFSPSGQYILTDALHEKAVHLWEVNSGHLIRTFEEDSVAFTDIAYSPDEKYILASSSRTIRLWNLETGELVHLISDYSASSVAFSPDGQTFLTIDSSFISTARLWNVKTGELIRIFEGDGGWGEGVAFSPDGQTIFIGYRDAPSQLRDVETGELIRSLDPVGDDSIAFSPDGQTILIGSYNTAYLREVDSGNLIRRFETSPINSVAFSPDGQTILLGTLNNTTSLWDVASGNIIRTFTGHTDSVTSVAFSPNGQLIATASADGTARLWDTHYIDSITYVCNRVFQELVSYERQEYGISQNDPTCPQFELDIFIQHGDTSLYEENDYQSALNAYTQALILAPQYIQLYWNRANIYFALRNYTAAIADYTSFLSLEPNQTDIIALRGRAYLAAGEYELAQADFETWSTLRPNDPSAYYWEAINALASGDYTLAIKLYEKTYLGAIDYFWKAIFADLQGKPTDAYLTQAFEQAEDIRPKDSSQRFIALCSVFQGDLEKAKDYYRQALEISVFAEGWFYHRIYLNILIKLYPDRPEFVELQDWLTEQLGLTQ